MKNFMYFIWGCIKFLCFCILAALCIVPIILFDKYYWEVIEMGKE